ncbi:hypothetical protein Hanom_Chr09g00853471 [Helianthus anomalus]
MACSSTHGPASMDPRAGLKWGSVATGLTPNGFPLLTIVTLLVRFTCDKNPVKFLRNIMKIRIPHLSVILIKEVYWSFHINLTSYLASINS